MCVCVCVCVCVEPFNFVDLCKKELFEIELFDHLKGPIYVVGCPDSRFNFCN